MPVGPGRMSLCHKAHKGVPGTTTLRGRGGAGCPPARAYPQRGHLPLEGGVSTPPPALLPIHRIPL